MRLKRINAPEGEPLNLEEVKKHLRVDGSSDDTLITAVLQASRMRLEEETKRAFITQSWQMILDYAGSVIEIPRPPLQEVTKIETIGSDGVVTEVSSDLYVVDTDGEGKGRVVLKSGCTWPVHRGYSSFIISFTTGYGEAKDVPSTIKRAILLYVTYLYENRGDKSISVPVNIQNLIAPYKVLII